MLSRAVLISIDEKCLTPKPVSFPPSMKSPSCGNYSHQKLKGNQLASAVSHLHSTSVSPVSKEVTRCGLSVFLCKYVTLERHPTLELCPWYLSHCFLCGYFGIKCLLDSLRKGTLNNY